MKSIIKKLENELSVNEFTLNDYSYDYDNDDNDVENGYPPYEKIQRYQINDEKTSLQFYAYFNDDKTAIKELDFEENWHDDESYETNQSHPSFIKSKQGVKRFIKLLNILEPYMQNKTDDND